MADRARSRLHGVGDIDHGVTYRRHRGWVIVKFDNYAYSASGTESNLGTLPTGFRPNASVYAALAGISGGSTSDAYCVVYTGGVVKANGRASGAKLYGEIVFPV